MQILILKFLWLRYKILGHLKIEQTQYLLQYFAVKSKVLQLLSYFDKQEDIKYPLYLSMLREYLFITKIKIGE